jgi:hypothetical protein
MATLARRNNLRLCVFPWVEALRCSLLRSKQVISPMPRWDVLLAAAALAGGSMLIERSHRVDTGAPDEAVASAPADCTAMRTVVYAVGEPYEVSRGRAAAAVPSDCGTR